MGKGVGGFNDDGGVVGLTLQADDLRMTHLAENDNLRTTVGHGPANALVGITDALLQIQNHRTTGIDNLNMVLLGDMIGRGRLPMRTEQNTDIVQSAKVVVVDGLQPQLRQPLHLLPVVDNVAQTE